MEFLNQPPSTDNIMSSSTEAEASSVQPQKKPLVVRVKRKRNQESVDTICVEEHRPVSKKRGMAGLAFGLNSLSHMDSTRILLTRIETISELGVSGGDEKSADTLDSSTYNALKRSRGSDTACIDHDQPVTTKKNRDDFRFIVTKNKKVFTSEGSTDAMIFVDMTSVESTSLRQDKVSSSHASSSSRSVTTASGVSPKKGRRVLDPVTRMLSASITTALATGDFTDMLAALEQGADVDFQRTDTDGFTCLMAAVQMSNLKVVSKLLCKNANTLLQNEVTQTAIDIAEYAKLESKHHSASMILIMVRDKASEQYVQLQKSLAADSGSGGEGEGEGEDYVYDIYTCHHHHHHHRPTASSSSSSSAGADPNSSDDQKADTLFESIPSVKVSGLYIDDMGNAEIDFHYDSDWSDLAHDDDDEDSNDENYFGNDYPEEDATSNDGYERNFDKMTSRSDDENENGGGGSEDDVDVGDEEEEEEEEEGGRLPRFDRAGIGRQLKPFVVGEHQSSFGKTAEEIEQMWTLEELREMEDDEQQQHATRLGDMGKRTGMHVGAQPREFDSRGLPKFGVDLSDDDGEAHYSNFEDHEQYSNEAYDSGDESC